MSKKYPWLKISGSLLLVVLFFLVLNSFFRENIRLLDERNTWQEKVKELEAKAREFQAKNEELERILMPERRGLIVTDLRFETLTFNNNHRLTYNLALTIENRLTQALPEGEAHLLLAFASSGVSTFQRISGQRVTIPPFRAGEVKTISFPGAIEATPGEEMLLVISLDQQPGVAKLQVRLADPAEKKNSSPQ